MNADVSSIPALREWLAALVTYQHDAGDAMSGIQQEVRRGFDWLEQQLDLWQRAIRDCEEEVVQAKAELAARRFPGFDGRMPDTTVQERNLRRAEAKLEYAEEKVRTCKRWLSRLPKLVEETFTGHAHRLTNFLEGDVARGVAVLDRQIDALERYAGLRTDYSSNPSAVPPPPKE